MNTGAVIMLIIGSTATILTLIGTTMNIIIKREQIKANTAIRIEEIKAKNQLDLEKLMREDHQAFQGKSEQHRFAEASDDSREVRERVDA